MTLDVAGPTPGRRTQVTRLPGNLVPLPTTCCPVFLDRRTISFSKDGARFTIDADGTGLRAIPSPMATEGSRIIPQFVVAGGRARVHSLNLGGEEVNRYPPIARQGIYEVFLLDGDRFLQLTNFGRSDTSAILSGDRVYFSASANPLGTNPGENCQLFSMNTLGRDLRQITRFRDEVRPSYGCIGWAGSACNLSGGGSAVSDGVWLQSNCDPLGTNPLGEQIFSLRRDGSNLRQLTAMRGMEIEPDGTVRVELVHGAYQTLRYR